MKNIKTEVLVIGGGATGTGIARDLAMRGFDTILVEKGDLTHGTTGRYHGLLHSGARYAIKDPQAALECIQENSILRRIMPQCIEDTGGFFVLTEWDDPEYADRFFAGCQEVGIPIEEVSVSQMLREEPLLNPKITRCFRVPDASADSFLGAELNAESARQYNAKILNYHKVIRLIPNSHQFNPSDSSSKQPVRVAGALCHDLLRDEQLIISADITINATGAWVGLIAGSIGVNIPIIGGKGTMVAVNHRIVNTVINRCKMPADGDILVPVHTVAVIGTTDIPVKDPDQYAIEPWEVKLCLEEGEKLIPGFKQMRMLRAWAGVRPLYQETKNDDTRNITRAFVLLDHANRDGIEGFLSITSGKWTTYRKMAESTVDLVCHKLNVERACRTHQESLPSRHGQLTFYQLGHRLQDIESQKTYGELVCECELATRHDVERSIIEEDARSLDDIRRDIRLGMGPCQGGFCAIRAIGILHEIKSKEKNHSGDESWLPESNLALRDFLQERWKGLLPVLWGQQLRQEHFNEFVYLYLLNAGQLPGSHKSLISPLNYTPPKAGTLDIGPTTTNENTMDNEGGIYAKAEPVDVLVIGAGLAGLVAAWQFSSRGRNVHIVSKGWGTNHWGSGCIDVYGMSATTPNTVISNPRKTILRVLESDRFHPYSMVGIDAIQQALISFQELCQKAGYPLIGKLSNNWLLPTTLGVIRPTCLAPETMIAGDLRSDDPMLIVGFDGYHDFYPDLIADNLVSQGFEAKGVTLSLPSLQTRKLINNNTLAKLFDDQAIIEEIYQAIKEKLKDVKRVGFPAVLGIQHAKENHKLLADFLGCPVFEIPTLPPSIPGIRLHNILVNAIQSLHGVIQNGLFACGAIYKSNKITGINTLTSHRIYLNEAQTFILATGGILGGGINTDYNGYAQDSVLGFPIRINPERTTWHARDFIHPEGHPIHRAGFDVNSSLQILNLQQIALENAFAIGSALGGYDGIPERSLEGVAIATGHFIGSRL